MASVRDITGAMSVDAVNTRVLLDAALADLTDLRTKYAALLAKLDADTGITDTNYAATVAAAAAELTP